MALIGDFVTDWSWPKFLSEHQVTSTDKIWNERKLLVQGERKGFEKELKKRDWEYNLGRLREVVFIYKRKWEQVMLSQSSQTMEERKLITDVNTWKRATQCLMFHNQYHSLIISSYHSSIQMQTHRWTNTRDS